MSVVPLVQKRLRGECRCLECGHQWEQLCPVGEHTFECPECKTYKGVLLGLVRPEKTQSVWHCDCGCDMFHVLEHEFMCVRCGTSQRF